MDTLSILTHFLSTILLICTGFSKADTKSQHFTIHVGQKFNPELDHFEGEAVSMMQCANLCTLDNGCTSASFHDVVGTCLLSEVHIEEPNGGQEMSADPSWSALSTKVGQCFGGWSPVGDYCYFVLDPANGINFGDAKQFCESLGGWLAEPRDENMHQLISNFLWRNHDHSGVYWIALKSEYVNSTFVWDSDDQVPPYTKWHNPIEPHTAFSLNCVFLHVAIDSDEFLWVDDDCEHNHFALCQANWLD